MESVLHREHDDNVSISTYNNNKKNYTAYLNISLTKPVSPVTLTSAELWIQLVFFYIFFSGIITNVLSVAIWVGILRKKNLRTRFFIIIGFLTFCRTCSCTNFLSAGIYRSLCNLGFVSFTQPRIVCHFFGFWFINGGVLEQALLMALVVDRVIALAATSYFRLMSDKSAAYICIALYIVVTLFIMGPSYMLDNMLEKAQCVTGSNFLNENFNLYCKNMTLALVSAVFVLYCVLILYLRLRTNALEASAEQSEAAKLSLQRQLKLMPMFRNVVLVHCGFAFTSRLLVYLAVYIPAAYGQRLTLLSGIAMNIDLFANVISLLVINKDVRTAAIPWWGKNHVASLETSSPN